MIFRILPMSASMKEAIVFLLILFAFIFLMCWIEVPPLVDKCSRNAWRNQGQHFCQDIPSLKVGDNK